MFNMRLTPAHSTPKSTIGTLTSFYRVVTTTTVASPARLDDLNTHLCSNNIFKDMLKTSVFWFALVATLACDNESCDT